MQQCRALALSPTIVSITPSNLQNDLPGEGDRGDGREGTGSEINENSNEDANATGHEEVHENSRRNHSNKFDGSKIPISYHPIEDKSFE